MRVKDLFANAAIVDLIMLLTLVEVVILAVYHRSTGRGISLADLAPNLLSGTFLLLALRSALVSAHWTWTAAALTGSLLAHLIDLYRRWHW
jgi:hypothetical protein